jgi:hypothetical protein
MKFVANRGREGHHCILTAQKKDSDFETIVSNLIIVRIHNDS